MKLEALGRKIGFILMFFIATLILFFILKGSNRLPAGWNYLYIFGLVLLITLIGIFIKKILK